MKRAQDLISDWRWPVGATLVSLAMLATAHAVEHFAQLAPCPLCLRQRDVYWALAAMGIVGLVLWRLRPTRRFLTALNIMIGLVFVTGAIVAAFHTGVEYGWWEAPAGCAAGEAVSTDDILRGDLLETMDTPTATVSCTTAVWHLFGLSMAGWNALVSAGLAAISFLAAAVTAQRMRNGAFS
jgi:disulfide bond formation protein DsbB